MIQKLLYLEPGDLKRLLPFFGFYLALSVMLSVGDGLSLALFVNKVGASQLPFYYGITALGNLVLIALYMAAGEWLSNLTLFRLILMGSSLSFLLSWAFIEYGGGGSGWYGLFFISREISYTMVIMHFGNFLQDYFTRGELKRVLSLVYSAGRIGGILGGVLLGTLSATLGTMNMVLLYIVLGFISLVLLWPMGQLPHVEDAEEEKEAPKSLAEFLLFFKTSKLLIWLTIGSSLFVVCRRVLMLEYNDFFEHFFQSAAQMAQFLGWYTSIAMVLSLLVQVFVVNRLVAFIGVTGAHFLFAFLLLTVMGVNLVPMTLGLAIFSRLMETEFRVGFRNPIIMLMNNHFPKGYRKRARAWTMGAVIPMATLASAGLLEAFQNIGGLAWIGWLGFALSVLYLVVAVGLYHTFDEDIPLLRRLLPPKAHAPQEKVPVLVLEAEE